jgi:hypothetical protein
MGDRVNYGSGEFRGTRVVAPKSDRQTANLDQRLSSLRLHASIAHELYRSPRTFMHQNGMNGYEVGRF